MERPKIGVGVFVVRDGKILMGKRKNSHGAGSWSIPGGHLEMNELIEECAMREVLEETGVKIKNAQPGPFTQDIFNSDGKHYITIFVLSEHDSGDPKIVEPDKFEEVNWFSLDNLPNPLFLPLQNLLKDGFNPVQALKSKFKYN